MGVVTTPRRRAPGRQRPQGQGPAAGTRQTGREILSGICPRREQRPHRALRVSAGLRTAGRRVLRPSTGRIGARYDAPGSQALRSPRHGTTHRKRFIARTQPQPITRWVFSTTRSNSRARPSRSGPGRSSSAGWPCPMMNRARSRTIWPGTWWTARLRRCGARRGRRPRQESGDAGAQDGRVLEYPGRRPLPGWRISSLLSSR